MNGSPVPLPCRLTAGAENEPNRHERIAFEIDDEGTCKAVDALAAVGTVLLVA